MNTNMKSTTQPAPTADMKTNEAPETKAKEESDVDVITRYRFAVRQTEELLGAAPGSMQARVVTALAQAATVARVREVGFEKARKIAADVIRRELEGGS